MGGGGNFQNFSKLGGANNLNRKFGNWAPLQLERGEYLN